MTFLRALAGLAAVLALSGGTAQPRVRTLLTTSSPITAFAQDGRFIAWATRAGGCSSAVFLRNVSTGRTTQLTRKGTPGCGMEAPVNRIAVAANGASATAVWSRYETGNNFYDWLFAGSTQTGRERSAGLVSESTGDELWLALAGDGPFLGYGWAHATEDLNANLPYTILHGNLNRVSAGGAVTPVAASPAIALLAAGGGTVVDVPRGQVGAQTTPRPILRDLEIRDGKTLGVSEQITAGGQVLGIACSGKTVAVLVPGAIETHPVSAEMTGKTAVPRLTSRDLAVGGSRVAYHVGRTIYELGRRSPLAVAASTPVGFSADGPRLAWAEGRRIRALTLP